MDGVPESVARESLRLAATKLPLRTKFLTRHHAAAPTTGEKGEAAADHSPATAQRPPDPVDHQTIMKIKEIRELSSDELVSRKRELRQESFNLRLQQQERPDGAPSRLRDIRREVARIETILSERANKKAAAGL